MQTNFSDAQLADSATKQSEKILRTCVHCGFCNATCPTYTLLGDELDGPRGRIYLIKSMLESGADADVETVRHVDRCLSCLSCMTTCPSGVNYMHLVDHARIHIERTYRRPFADRAMRSLLAIVLPRPWLFRLSLIGTKLIKPFAAFLPARLKAMLALAPKHLKRAGISGQAASFKAEGVRKRRVALLTGCAQRVIGPEINDATIRLLTRHGCEIVTPPAAQCCGALTHHMGREHDALAAARRTIDAWTREIEGEGLDAIAINTSGCGTTVKDYGFMLRDDPAYAAKAAKIASLARDVTELMDEIGLNPVTIAEKLTVAYHSACSMQHGQSIRRQPKSLLAAAGFEVRDIPEGHLCCGSAGTYNLLQPEIAGQLRDRKLAAIGTTGAKIVATGNIGCITQLGSGGLTVVHTVELLDWATGGEKPLAMR